ncbi:helix-turn-helix domain-containing protein [Aquibacillus sp. 3ASR75-11]|uniref:Helix-turn-helix domain-containing protein n=1 Tax=Terrihalobacillus insolitus TaxID=2950438 RepID=A0A9X3WTC0_9BACI|nr:helix-turn-helix transcriptional regulator [Terrihalobacillus insolitus]MDC3424278.1 helix-turn-helix domain-containing protein [Terrihalobacillus insolitus]
MITQFEEINEIEDDHERLIILRKRLGKTQYQLAMELGYSESYIGQVENYKQPFSDKLRARINHYLVQEKVKEKDATDLFSNFG